MRLAASLPAPLARQGYRLAWRCLTLWWRLTRPHRQGAAVAVVHAGRLLVVRPTYRAAWVLPGGLVDRGESPAEAARRELHEEAGIMVSAGTLIPLGEVGFAAFGARFTVALFRHDPPRLPDVRVDGREIGAAAWLSRGELAGRPLGREVELMLERHGDRLLMVSAGQGVG
jgi:8-oxo-dGTP pyrophosphatase MutT (NUDIX family)